MLQQLTSSISTAIKSQFDYDIYKERIPQGFKPSCFVINCTNFDAKHIRGLLYNHSYTFKIDFYPSNIKELEMQQVSINFCSVTQNILLDNEPIYVSGFSSYISDEILTVTLNFDLIVTIEQAETEKMEKQTYTFTIRR